MTQISISEVLELKTFRGDKGEGYIVHCDDNHWNRAFKIPDRRFIRMCSDAVSCLSADPKGLTLPKPTLQTIVSSTTLKNKFKQAYNIPISKTIYEYKIERGKIKYRLYWVIEAVKKCVSIFEFKSRNQMRQVLGWKE